MSNPFNNLIPLPTVTFCGNDFGHSHWFRHLGSCPICKEKWPIYFQSKKELLISSWDTVCLCGCGNKTPFGKRFYKNHHVITDSFREKKRQDCLQNPLMSNPGAREKISSFWRGRKRDNQKGDRNSARKEEVRLKISQNNPMKNGSFRKKQKEACNSEKEKKRRSLLLSENNPSKNPIFLEKRIDTYTRNLAEGKYSIKNNWKTGWFTKKDGTKEWFDSSYEERAMTRYEEENVKWTKKHGIRIPYTSSKGVKTYYVPDFLVYRNGIYSLEEVKGWLSLSVKEKAKVAISFCREKGYTYLLLLGPNLLKVDELSSPIEKE
jgi:hypothetical protein